MLTFVHAGLATVGPLVGLLIGAWLQQASAGRTWWRDRRADAYARVLAAVEDLRHRFDEITEIVHFGEPPLDSDDLIRLTKGVREARAPAFLYAGRHVRRAVEDFITTAWSNVDRLPEDIPYQEILEAADAVVDAMQQELRGGFRLRRP